MDSADLVLRVTLSVVFAVAVWSKLHTRLAFTGFERAVSDLGLPTRPLGIRTAAVVVTSELAAVALLWAAPVVGYTLLLVLLVSFTVVFVRTLRVGGAVPCRCFGGSGAPIGKTDVVRNASLICGALAGLGCHAARGDDATLHAWLLATSLGGLLGVLVTRWDDLAFLFSRKGQSSGSGVFTRGE